jgi:hypothetical protein
MRITLATTKKDATMMAEFYSKMKNIADEMAAAGQPLGDEEFVAYVLTLMRKFTIPWCHLLLQG